MPPRPDRAEERDLALGTLVHVAGVQAARVAEELRELTGEVRRLAEAIVEANARANPWAVAGAAVALVGRAIDRTPGWAWGVALVASTVALAVSVAPDVGPVLVQILRLAPGAQAAP